MGIHAQMEQGTGDKPQFETLGEKQMFKEFSGNVFKAFAGGVSFKGETVDCCE
jgi:hypothetical protein